MRDVTDNKLQFVDPLVKLKFDIPNMEIRQLKAFLAIAEAKTFTAGARRVNVTQAAISMQIRQLEEEVGLPLFTRTPRSEEHTSELESRLHTVCRRLIGKKHEL